MTSLTEIRTSTMALLLGYATTCCAAPTAAEGSQGPIPPVRASVVQGGEPIRFRLDDTLPVAFHGLADNADPGQSGTMLYPAFGVAGLFAAIATHAVLVKTNESSERSRQQELAEAVLDPFRPRLTNLSLHTLLNRPLELRSSEPEFQIVPETETSVPAWRLELSPTFLLSKDQRVLILEAQVKALRQPGGEGSPYSNILRVISSPRQDIAMEAPATPEQVQHLIDDSSALLEQALAMLSRSLRNEEGPGQGGVRQERTVRYKEGDKQRFERGVVLSESCERVELQTLRGWLMSVPQQSRPTQASCMPH